ncbi:MAG: general secretion pathway protein GspB [Dokdonella sp.]
MSLILEALKKSERQRRLGESPSIGSPVMAVRRRRSLLPVIIVLIVIGLAALWWLQRGTGEPALTDKPATAATPPARATIATPAPAVVQPSRVADGTTFNDAPVAAAPKQAPSAVRVAREPTAQAQARNNAEVEQRRKVRDGELVAANPQAGPAATIKESEPVSAADPAALAAAMANAGKSAPVPAKIPANTKVEPAVAVPSSKSTPAVTPVAVNSAGNALKLMWELPLATRSKLPEIKLSMHVFAADPTQRFVIINDERRAEGDDIDGMKLVEIRTDGLVFEFDNVRFLYPRGGR